MFTIENYISYEVIQKIGWVLLHFIWQAAAAALVLAVILRILRRFSANLRYITACLSLILIVLLPVITIQFIEVSSSPPQTENANEPVTQSVIAPIYPAIQPSYVTEPQVVTYIKPEPAAIKPSVNWKQKTISFLEPKLPYLVTIWLLGVFALSIWHLGGYTQLQKLRRKMVKQVDASLHDKLKILAQKLGVTQAVQLLESALVQIPTVVGWIKPVILLPASALTGLSAEQLEAILAHELAHIKRYDYLVNMLQTVVEILGFYHPAVWWISHKIRTERENCCDDIAVSVCGNRINYAKALTLMEEIRGRNNLAVAATGGNLFSRIRRLLVKDSSENNSFSWLPSLTIILLLIALAIPTTIAFNSSREEDPNDTKIEKMLIDGFRENRDKFKCGILAWNRTTISNGFDSLYPWDEYQTKGSFKLWWDGEKTATRYVDERLYTGVRGSGIEAVSGGNIYDGGLLSRKPKYSPYENWFEQIIRWEGLVSLDKYIEIIKKNKNTIKWSIIEGEDGKQIKFVVKELEQNGLSGIQYFDISRGYNLIRDETYNSRGQLRSLQTRKLEEIGDGWFPIEVDMKSFDPNTGKVTFNNHFALEFSQCSFNEPDVLPKGIFDFSTAKEHEQLNKILEKYSKGTTAYDDNMKSACDSVKNYITAIMTKQDEKSLTFAYPESSIAHSDENGQMREILKGQQVQLIAVSADDWNALVTTSVILGDHGRIGPMVFQLKRLILEQKEYWLIDDIDLETIDSIEEEYNRFLETNSDAKTIMLKPPVSVESVSGVAKFLAALEDKKYINIRGGIIPLVDEIGDREPIAFLAKQLQANSRERRCNAALMLELLDDKRGVPAIIKELNDTSYRSTIRIRSDGTEDQRGQVIQDHYYAALLLGILADKRATPALIEATKDETIDYQAAISLGQIGDKSAVPALRDMLKRRNENTNSRLYAASSLAMLGDEEGFKIVIDIANNKLINLKSRCLAIEALVKLDNKEAVPDLIASLKDEHPNIRASAAKALGEIGDVSALPALEQALEDKTRTESGPYTRVNQAAAEAITQIQNQSKDTDASQNETEKESSDTNKIDSGTKVLIEAQILHVNNEIPKQIGLDDTSLKNSNTWTQYKISESSKPISFVINSPAKDKLLQIVDESKEASSISHIFMMTTSDIKNIDHDKAENTQLSDDQTLLILGGKEVSLQDLKNNIPIIKNMPAISEFLNTISKTITQENQIILIKATPVSSEQKDNVELKALSDNIFTSQLVKINFDLNLLEPGQYVEIKNRGKREFNIQQVACESGKKFPCYAGNIVFDIRSNSDLSLAAQRVTSSQFFEHDEWDASFTDPNEVTSNSNFSVKTLHLNIWNAKIYKVSTTDNIKASYVTIQIKPSNKQSTEEQTSEKLEKIRRSFDNQRAMFQNMRFTAIRTQPYSVALINRRINSELQLNVKEIPGKQKITEQSYQINKTGKFLFSYQEFVKDSETGQKIPENQPFRISFNGKIYRNLLSDKIAVISTPEQPFDPSGPMIKPTFYMDHLFNDKILKLLSNPNNITISELENGLWHLTYKNPDTQSNEFFDIDFDPAREFIITKIQGNWAGETNYTKEIEYSQTEQGFYYPLKGTLTLSGNEPSTMQITEFQLNGPEGDYTQDIPDGAEITDYSRNTEQPVKYIFGKTRKTYEDIVNGVGKFIDGVVLDPNGYPIPDVYVETRCLKITSDSNQTMLDSSTYLETLNATTDSQGRFAIEYEEDGAYTLRLNAKNHADAIVYDIKPGTRDLKVTLTEGGTISGRLIRIENGRKIPIAGEKIKIEDDGIVFNSLKFKEVVTDSQGRFHFENLQTQIRPIESSNLKDWKNVPRVWIISYGTTSKSVVFYDHQTIENLELVVNPSESQLSVGNHLPDFNGIMINFSERQNRGKKILICFWDLEQRPSRNLLLQLSKRAEKLKEKGIEVITIQASKINENSLNNWLKENNIFFLSGMIEGKEEQIRSTWGIKSLPWLILTDSEHVITDQGFTIIQLDQKTGTQEDDTGQIGPPSNEFVINTSEEPEKEPEKPKNLFGTQWGKAVDGVQVRLQADKKTWEEGEIPKLKADVRNNGSRDLIIYRTEQVCELIFDGQSYHCNQIEAKSSPFPHGKQYDGIEFSLDGQWYKNGTNQPLQFSSGKHTIQVAFTLDDARKGAIEPVTNPVIVKSNQVEIETLLSEGNKEVIASNENLEILGIDFKPVRQGKNEVYIKVRNKTDKEQILLTRFITSSPDESGEHGIGWASLGSFETIRPRSTETVREVYKIERPINDYIWIWLILHNPQTIEEGSQAVHFFEKRFYVKDMERSTAEIIDTVPANQTQTNAIYDAFGKIKDFIKNQEYAKLWELCTKDYKQAQFHGTDNDAFGIFKNTMEQDESGAYVFIWDRNEFLNSQLGKVTYKDGIFYLAANSNEKQWLIHFKMEEDQYKIDWIDGFTPRYLKAEQENRTDDKSEVGKKKVLIEMKLLEVNDNFLREQANIKEFLKTKASPVTPDPNKWFMTAFLDNSRIESLFDQESDNYKKLAAPKLLVFDNEAATISSVTDVPYVSGYTEPNNTNEISLPVIEHTSVGFTGTFTPHIDPDNQDIIMEYELKYKQIVGYQERIFNDKYKERVPLTLTRRTDSTTLISYGKTLAANMGEVNSEKSNSAGEKKDLLVLIKPTIVQPEQMETQGHIDNNNEKDMIGPPANEFIINSSQNIQPVMEQEKSESGKSTIQVESQLIQVEEDFLEELATNPDFEFAPEKFLDDLQVKSFLKAIKSDQNTKIFKIPYITTFDNVTGSWFKGTKIPFLTGYREPNKPSEQAKPVYEMRDIGTNFEFKPTITPDEKNITLQFTVDISRIIGSEEQIFNGKYKEDVPVVDRSQIASIRIIPNGKTFVFDCGQPTTNEISDPNPPQKKIKTLILIKPKIILQEEAKETIQDENGFGSITDANSQQQENKNQILVETKVLKVSNAFLEQVGLDANSLKNSDVWSKYRLKDTNDTNSFVINSLSADLLLKSIRERSADHIIARPKILVNEGKQASIVVKTEDVQLSKLDAKAKPSVAESIRKIYEGLNAGIFINLLPEITGNNNVRLDVKVNVRDAVAPSEEMKINGVIVQKGRTLKEKEDTSKEKLSAVTVFEKSADVLIPDRDTLLIVGPEITHSMSREARHALINLPILDRLFTIQGSFRIVDEYTLLILIKTEIVSKEEFEKMTTLPVKSSNELGN